MRFAAVLLVSLALLISGCVTTMNGPFTENVSIDKEVEARVQVALTYLQDNKPEDAIYHLKIAVDKAPKSPRVHEVLGLALAQTGEYTRAEKHFKKMLKYDPSYSRGRSNYASFLITQQRYEDAAEQLHVVVDDIYYRNRAAAYWELGHISKQLGNEADVETYYLRAVGLDPRFANAYLELAEIKFSQQDYAKSYEFLANYRKNVKQSNAKGLLLGIKLARVFKDRSEEASFALALKNLYPRSDEYLEYINGVDIP